MKCIQSNSKEPFIFWLREIKNFLLEEKNSLQYYNFQKYWKNSLGKNKMENQQFTLQETFNDRYKIELNGETKIVRPKNITYW